MWCWWDLNKCNFQCYYFILNHFDTMKESNADFLLPYIEKKLFFTELLPFEHKYLSTTSKSWLLFFLKLEELQIRMTDQIHMNITL